MSSERNSSSPIPSGVRAILDTIATVLVILVAVVILYRLFFVSQPQPSRTAAALQAARPEPPLPSEPVSIANTAFKGQRSASVAIVAFSDFQCPYCRAFAQNTWPALQREYVDTGRVAFAFKHLPLESIHPFARKLAEAAECARRQDQFWPFHDGLFERQRDIATLDLDSYAQELGLDTVRLAACQAGDSADAVNLDSSVAASLAVSGTPTFFVGRLFPNGTIKVTSRLVGAKSIAEFATAIELAEKKGE